MRFPALSLSLLLHGAVIGGLVVTVPRLADDPIYIPPVPVDVLSRAEFDDLVSIPAESATEEPAEREEPAPLPEPAPEPAPQPEPDPTPEPEPEPEPAPEPEPEPQPAPEPAPEPEPQPEAEPEPQLPEPDPEPAPPTSAPEPDPVEDLDFDSLSDGLVDLTPDRPRTAPRVVGDTGEGGERDQPQIGPGGQLSITEEAALQACVRANRVIDLSARDADQFVVELRIVLNIDQTLAAPIEITNQAAINRSGNPAYQAAARNAVAAVRACLPLDALDPARYQQWRVINFRFRPGTS
ncbi:hypothetical protein PB2503_03342 [Parvularcula bermudensis HTCC2503]|uniref:Uncharacterized protein n=1 Tax=Parvularcula bermudensis (strain ATCC BAA-594 / HTCC2503 / KCTC 12087) TaxID=314260 RepID=E0TDI9_PARBH|nr:hypothetical protein [Parvularcula bermudensis]ADM08744.1 hypothetical protein PB2503_03342 [Parvularcula bermudensis HTCC2503]